MKVFEGFTNIFKSDDYDDDDFVNEEDYIADEDDDDYETRQERRAKKDKVKEKKSSLFGGFKKTSREDKEDPDASYYESDGYGDDESYKPRRTVTPEASGISTEHSVRSGSSGIPDNDTESVNSFGEKRGYERAARVEQPRDRKVVPLRNTSSKGFEVVVIHPQSLDEGCEITETLLSGKAVIISLEGINPDVAQRIIDYTAGSCYAMRGNLQKINNYIFLVAPSGVDISGDFHDVLSAHSETVSYGNDFSMN